MSHKLINLSPDLKRLRDEGYDVDVRAGHLVVRDVPYVTTGREVKRGILTSTLDLAGDRTAKPGTHVAMFSETPCHADGRVLTEIINQSSAVLIEPGLTMTHSFSSKPANGYADYYEKMTTYIRILGGEAHALEPNISAQTHPVLVDDADSPIFQYLDTASSRSQITPLGAKLMNDTIAIVGLGGTGSYVLDLVAKAPVRAIHIFDGDDFLQHNAFRTPGAASIGDLQSKSKKAHYLASIYARMHRHIVPHAYFLDASNLEELKGITFAFVCVDRGAAKRPILEKLTALGISYVDVGMGLYIEGDQVHGILRTTASTPTMNAHVQDTVSFADLGDDGAYRSNIQIADLNALNAALAVIRWKKHRELYGDTEHEHSSLYVLGGNVLINEDRAK